MNRLLLAFVLALITITGNLSSTEQLSLERGAIAVYLKPIAEAGNDEFNGESLLNCLENHIDYYLWLKGWGFAFVLRNTVLDGSSLIDSLSNSRYRYLLYVETEASFRTGTIRTISSDTGGAPGKYPGFLKIKLTTSLFDLDSGAKIVNNDRTRGGSRRLWVESGDGGYLPEELSGAEPPDFVVRRVLSEALSFLPVFKRLGTGGKGDIPICVVADKRILDGKNDSDDGDLNTALDYISRSLRRQFGFGLKITAREHLTVRGIPFSGMKALFKSLLKAQPARDDTMTIAVFRPEMPEQFYESGRKTRIGLSDLGKQILLAAELSPPDRMTAEWKAFLAGQLLLHEVGHLLGAIHVSDLNSVMAPRTTWVSPDRFDPLNESIIGNGRKIGLPSRRITEYLDFVTRAIRKTDYKLADYPATYFSYINLNRKQFQNSPAGDYDFARSISYAVEGYRLYLLKNDSRAKDFFYKALACDSTQGALHYYLSKVTIEELSKLHLKKSAEIGFYRAISDYVVMGKM